MKGNQIKYVAIYEELKKEINDGKYPVGGTFPAEPELQERFGVSRITVRNAVKNLVDEGYLMKIHGIGTIVLSHKESLQLQSLQSFHEEHKDKNVHSSLYSFETDVPAGPMVRSQLDLARGEKVICHERIRWIDDKPISFQRVYTPPFIKLEKEEIVAPDASLYEQFEKMGYIVTSAQETIESIVADSELAMILQVEENKPLLYIQRVTKDQNERIVEYTEFFYRGDQYRYNVQLHR